MKILNIDFCARCDCRCTLYSAHSGISVHYLVYTQTCMNLNCPHTFAVSSLTLAAALQS